MRRWFSPIRLVAVATVLAVALGACGGGRTPAETSTSAGQTDETAVTGSSAGDSRPADSDTSQAAGTGSTEPAPTRSTPTTLHVPADFASVQAAVDSAIPGDMVLIDAGTYTEAVVVRVEDIVIRGVDRNSVVFDGGDEIENGFTIAANGVAVENLTLRRYAFNGLLFTKAYDDDVDAKEHTVLNGYRASYVTANNNGAYGIYAFFARGGRIEHTYTSGQPDSGIYVGQCKPCDAVLSDNVSEHNAIGYSGTNSSGNLFVINSVWSHNRIGMTPNSQDQERLAPQGDVVIAGNLVSDNQDPGAPATPKGASGFGIAVSGGERNQVLKNRVTGNASAGIALTDLNDYKPSGNVVSGNVLDGNGTDLLYAFTSGSPSLDVAGNCFAGNRFSTSQPDRIEEVMPCGSGPSTVTSGAMRLQNEPPDVDYRTIPFPPPQSSMSDPSAFPATPVSRGVPTVDLTSITVPSATAGAAAEGK